MSAAPLVIDQRQVLLGKRLGKGGEGEVYSIEGDGQHAVKIYTLADTADRERKISAMISARLAAHAPEVAFPLSVARTRNGKFAGFLMRLVADHKPLHELYSPGSRKLHFPRADYRFTVRTVLNIAKAVASVHKLGCVIGDINHSSILVSQHATVALIDSDSFQVVDGAQLFLCRVGVPEYTPPELQGLPLGSVKRTANHDAFGLAVVVFQMLFMGRHPFIGTVRRGELPPLPEAIRDFRFVYTESHDVGMDQPPGTPALSDFPKSVADGFEAAFGQQTRDRRPTAAGWIASLQELEKALIQCTEDKLHWYPSDASDCLWCAMEKALGATLFVPYVPPAETKIHPFDPGAGGFDLAAVWRQIETYPLAERLEFSPFLAQIDAGPSASARAAVMRKRLIVSFRVASALAALVLALSLPSVWIVWIPLALYALFGKEGGGSTTVETLTKQYTEIDGRFQIAMMSWRKKIGIGDSEQLLAALRDAKSKYASLGSEEQNQTKRYHQERRGRQLHAFLDGFEIRRAKIRGIGPAKQAALASYGIETAADVELERILNVPGFGPTNSAGLVDWRRKLESRFVYNERTNDLDRQELARISSHIQSRASTLRRTLLAGRSNLESLVNRVKAMAAIKDAEINRLHAVREQMRVDIEYLGGTVPASASSQKVLPSQPVSVIASAARPYSGGAASVSTTQPATHGLQSALCPRCGSAMVPRRARRGRWAGRQFWGCSRYPVCKGTRNV
jgi:DNA-binding helix-hairpin-helix protein with protein kinase domain